MKRIMLIAHRAELIEQAVGHAKRAGLTVGMEMASQHARHEQVVVASVQSLISKRRCRDCDGVGCDFCDGGKVLRMRKFNPHHFGLLTVDEAHHAPARSYREVLKYFRQNPDLRVLMVTATPERGDKIGMWNVCDSVAYKMDLRDAIAEGWLCPIRQVFITVEHLDLSRVATKNGGDLADGDLQRAMLGGEDVAEQEMLHAIAKPAVEQANGKPLLIFAAGKEHAEKLTAACNVYPGVHAECVTEDTETEERKRIIARYKSGETNTLVGCMVFCLDSETEILTSDGWVGIDEIDDEHAVANYEDGMVFFERPSAIIKRDRYADEKMIVAKSRRCDIRVTANHRMLYRTYRLGKFKVDQAVNLVGRKVQVPLCGEAAPLEIPVEQPITKTDRQVATAIRANSYVLRRGGMSAEDAKREARRRHDRRHSMRFAEPRELTIAECHFIGFWIGDGSRCQLQRGGVEYTCAQSMVYPAIIEWLDGIVAECGFNVRRREFPERPHNGVVTWSFCRGTGFGPQARSGGVFRLEPYLQKDGTPLFWAMTREQLVALLQGFWLADGAHSDGREIPSRLEIYNSNYELLSLLQAVASVRGLSATVTGGVVRRVEHSPMWKLTVTPRQTLELHDTRLHVEEGWKQERVWCVTSKSGNIITRRNGRVCVTGNCEGFDAPATEVVAIARPTKSVSLYLQMIGRGTRPLPGIVDGPETAEERLAAIAGSAKPACIILDFVGNSGRHKLISVADVLAGEAVHESDLAAAIKAAKKSDGPVNMEALIEKAKQARENREARKAEREEKARLEASHRAERCEYTTQDVDIFGGKGFNAETDYTPKPGGASTKQVAFLVKLGVKPEEAMAYSKGRAGAVLDALTKRTGADYIVPFGKHSGKRLADIPRGYVQWAYDSHVGGQKFRDAVNAMRNPPSQPAFEEPPF